MLDFDVLSDQLLHDFLREQMQREDEEPEADIRRIRDPLWGLLSAMTEQSQKAFVQLLQGAAIMHQLRGEATRSFTMGFVGPSKLGKSSALRHMFHFETHAGGLSENRTLSIKSFSTPSHPQLLFLDFPGSNEEALLVRSSLTQGRNLLDLIVLMANANTCHTSGYEEVFVDIAATALSQHTPVLICLHRCDLWARNLGWNSALLTRELASCRARVADQLRSANQGLGHQVELFLEGEDGGSMRTVDLMDLIQPTCFNFDQSFLIRGQRVAFSEEQKRCLKNAGVLSENDLFQWIRRYSPHKWVSQLDELHRSGGA